MERMWRACGWGDAGAAASGSAAETGGISCGSLGMPRGHKDSSFAGLVLVLVQRLDLLPRIVCFEFSFDYKIVHYFH
jgi:hypothetical protein